MVELAFRTLFSQKKWWPSKGPVRTQIRHAFWFFFNDNHYYLYCDKNMLYKNQVSKQKMFSNTYVLIGRSPHMVFDSGSHSARDGGAQILIYEKRSIGPRGILIARMIVAFRHHSSHVSIPKRSIKP